MTLASGLILVVGLAVLLFGRRLFWLFVAAAGFAVGFRWAVEAFAGRPEWIALLVAIGVAVLGALLAVWLQLVAIAVGGFLAGAYATLAAARLLQVPEGGVLWVAVVVAGLVAAVLLLWIWDWALVVLSALTGAALLVPLVPVSPLASTFLFVALLIVGVLVQAAQRGRQAPQSNVSRVSTARRS